MKIRRCAIAGLALLASLGLTTVGCGLPIPRPDRGEAPAAKPGQIRVTKGPGSRAAGLAMAFELIEAAQDRWRAVNPRISSPWSAPAPPSSTATS